MWRESETLWSADEEAPSHAAFTMAETNQLQVNATCTERMQRPFTHFWLNRNGAATDLVERKYHRITCFSLHVDPVALFRCHLYYLWLVFMIVWFQNWAIRAHVLWDLQHYSVNPGLGCSSLTKTDGIAPQIQIQGYECQLQINNEPAALNFNRFWTCLCD